MRKEIIFMALGGGQKVGASCYYMRLGESNIILDAGTGKENGITFMPDFHSLISSPYIESLGQISQIYISHAHADHIGYLTRLMQEAPNATVYMTDITRLLCEYQLYDRWYLSGRGNENQRLNTRSLLDRITEVSYMKRLKFSDYACTFFPAGHMPGAMMTFFRYNRRNILYTGDYSITATSFTDGCMLPENLNIDTLIMCGLHAKHPTYRTQKDGLFKRVKQAIKTVKQQRTSVMCYIPQLSKGIEFLKMLNECNTDNIPIYVDSSIMNVVHKMETLSIPVLSENNRIMGTDFPTRSHIYITSDNSARPIGFYTQMNVDFSLHEDFPQMKKFIKKLNPRQAVVVHCAKPLTPYDRTIEQEILADGECRTQFIFAEENEIYKL